MNKKFLYVILILMLLLYLKIILSYNTKENLVIDDFYQDKITYKLNLPKLENLISITLEKDTVNKTIEDKSEINNIIEILNINEITTTNESISDAPVNATEEIKVDFNFKEDKISTIIIYKRKNNYYIEQPYNGIYQIDKDKYSLIEKLLSN